MRRRGPEEEACGVWLDAAALKRRKVQTHFVKPGKKMLTLFPRERKPNVSYTQRVSAGTRQTSIASFITLQQGMASGNNRRSVSSHIKSQTNEESKKDTTHLDCLIQGLGDNCIELPLATSTPVSLQEPRLPPQSFQTSGHHCMGTPFLTAQCLPQSDIPIYAQESKESLAFSSAQDLESYCLLDLKEGKGNSPHKWKRLHGSKTNYQGMEGHNKPPGGKCHQPLDKSKLERKVSAKENRQAREHLQAYGESWTAEENTESLRQNPCPLSAISQKREKHDKDSWSQLFTEDSQGQRVIAHNTRAPFQDLTSTWNQSLGQSPEQRPDGPEARCQDGPTHSHLQPNLLFTQDSEGNQVMRHQLKMFI
ncbi:aurora kinase A and ninein-interacting protein [Perognathus longimembris pacificus]|uniref:aurora kinase A and ninein-interacting protein n=1 Tax=Perognathus longimembris pacificus TaxID=214514 RepID=UPI00201846D7|nr:aurora kinase A and ninein-interacting protein [Perognathus longimembris pacificus]